jgi:predicted nucleic-acid-binding Zn-ribbon protein
MAEECPRCHGGKYTSGIGYMLPTKPKFTLFIENVMAVNKKVHLKCNNCGYKETRDSK